MHFIKILKKFGPVLPCVIVAAMAGGSLAGYKAPVPVGNAQVAEAASRTKTGKVKKTASDTTKGAAETPAVRMAVSPAPTAAEDQNGSSESAASPASDPSVSINTGKTPSSLKDGVYVGSGRGYGGTTRVQVTVSGGRITNVQVLSNQDSPSFFARAQVLTSRIVAQQSVNLDAVSGATMSSRGILEGAAAALRQAGSTASARVSINTNQTTAAPTPTSSAESSKADTFTKGKFPYLDGAYMGTGDGNGGDIDVAVLMDNHTLKAVTILSAKDEDEPFLSNAKTMLPKFISNQTEKVDTVSGATHTSEGINEAVADALKNAKKVTEEAEKNATPTPTATSASESTATPIATPTSSTGTPTPMSTTSDASKTPTAAPTTTPTVSPATTPTPAASAGKYKDGTYELSHQVTPDDDDEFDPYTLTFKLTVENDKITSIDNIAGASDNTSYIRRASNGTSSKKGVVAQIIEKQGTDGVDTVSRATCTSKAIISAVSEKLKEIAN